MYNISKQVSLLGTCENVLPFRKMCIITAGKQRHLLQCGRVYATRVAQDHTHLRHGGGSFW